VHRTLVYGALSVCVIGIYVLAVVGLGALIQARGNLGISLLTTVAVAVLFQPLRSRLQRGKSRLIYGERDDPSAVTSRLGRRLEATLASEAVLPTAVETQTCLRITPGSHRMSAAWTSSYSAYYAKKAHYIILEDVKGVPVVIQYGDDDLDEFVPVAKKVLDSVEWTGA
jgi:hypothetical protein